MKLLIVDDEELTRRGLISSIDWESLGMDHILQADDGLNALRIARAEKPDIILCDVRMPRMDGIQFIERLETLLPDTSVIFMSGYSDKEYLKAAIKLNAVNYVEKPLNPQEITEAVLDAKERRQQKLRTRQNENLYSMETASRLALLLTRPYAEQKEAISELAAELGLRMMPGCSFTAYIVKLDTAEVNNSVLNDIRNDLDDFLKHYHLQSFHIALHAVYHVFHIFGNGTPSTFVLTDIEKQLCKLFAPVGSFFIGRGDTITGISGAWQSYTSAVVLLQSSFFFDAGSILTPDTVKDLTAPSLSSKETSPASFFSDLLSEKDHDGCTRFLEELHRKYYKNRRLLPTQVKDLYYKLFMTLNESRQKLQLTPDTHGGNAQETILEYLESCFTFQELHTMLVDKTALFFSAIDAYVPEDSTIFLIKDFINKHYAEDSLSIKEISDHVFLSAPYVCTYFKTQTGQTLNQYLTEFRMEKAKQLLSDPRFQIADISAKVGYSNGNYFSKSFKKFTGLTPSKYREKMLE